MSGLLSDFADLLGMEAGRVVRQTRRNAILIAVAVLFGLTAYVAGVTAGAIYAAQFYGPVAVAIVVCLAAIALMLAALVVLHFAQLRDKRRAERRNAQLKSLATTTAALLPVMAKSGVMGWLATAGGVIFLARDWLQPTHKSSAHLPDEPRLNPAHAHQTNGAINPYSSASNQESLR